MTVDFTARRQSSDGGVALLRQIDARTGLTASLASSLNERRSTARVQHDLELLVRQRVLSIALGYADCNDAARNGDDPALKLACGRAPDASASLASQPTLSRFERGRAGRELVAMSRALERNVMDRPARLARGRFAGKDPPDVYVTSTTANRKAPDRPSAVTLLKSPARKRHAGTADRLHPVGTRCGKCCWRPLIGRP